jgi:hypothetical protein
MAQETNKPELPALQPTLLKSREFAIKSLSAVVPVAYSPEDFATKPHLWAHWAPKLRTRYQVEISCEDFSWTAMFQIYASGDTWAKAQMLWVARHETATSEAPAEHRFKIDRTQNGYRIIHRETGKVIARDIVTKEEANARMAEEIAKAA